MNEEASARTASVRMATMTAKPLIRRGGLYAGNISQEVEIRKRGEVHAGQRSLRDRDVRLVPQADVRHISRDQPLNLLIQLEPPRVVERCGRLVEKPVDFNVAVVTAVESGRRHLLRVKHTPEDIG